MSNKINLNISCANMSREELETELDLMKNANMVQLKRIEEQEQQIYDLKRHLATSKSMEEHFASEIESLQNNNDSKFDDLLKKVCTQEEQINMLKQKDITTVQYYEAELLKKDLEIANIINNTKSTQNTYAMDKNEKEKYTDEIYELKSKFNDLTDNLNEYELKYKDVSLNNTILENKNIELSKELLNLKEHLNIKGVQLSESKELISNLQDEISVMQREMDNLKTLPVNKATKGNSLFAEVDDNRVKLQKNIQILKKKFAEMQLKYSNKSQELQKLHLEYAALIKEIENQNNSNDDQFELIKSYKKHIDNLNNTIQGLIKELEKQKTAYEKLISGDMKFAIEMISANRSEVLTIQQKLNSESLALAFSEHSQFETKKELKSCQIEMIRLRAKILSLTQNQADIDPGNNEVQPKTNNGNKWLTSSNTLFTHIDDSLLLSDKSFDDVDEPNSVGDNKIVCVALENKENLPKENMNSEEDSKEKKNVCKDLSELNINNTITSELVTTKKKKMVSFTANTLEPKLTNRSGRKIINILPTHISNIKKS